MDRWSTKDPCAGVSELARSLPNGVWLNLLVRDIEASLKFQTEILGVYKIYNEASFAILRFGETVWMLHKDDAYLKHPMAKQLAATSQRGVGCEIRLQGCDPDKTEAMAREGGFEILETAQNKPHGLREVFIVDPDGYVWAPCKAMPET